jgi:hydrogenase maturation protease HycI
MDSLKRDLKRFIKGKTAIVGMGNALRADDSAGSLLVQRLRGKVKADLFDVGVSLENYTGPIARGKPHTVILIDALHFSEKPGTVRLFRGMTLATLNVSTHALSLEFFINFLKEKDIRNIAVLGIQPGSVDFHGAISRQVKKALSDLEVLLTNLCG